MNLDDHTYQVRNGTGIGVFAAVRPAPGVLRRDKMGTAVHQAAARRRHETQVAHRASVIVRRAEECRNY